MKMRAFKENGKTVFVLTFPGGREERVTSKELVEMKKAGKQVSMRDFVSGKKRTAKRVKRPKIEEVKIPEKPLTQWASVEEVKPIGKEKIDPSTRGMRTIEWSSTKKKEKGIKGLFHRLLSRD